MALVTYLGGYGNPISIPGVSGNVPRGATVAVTDAQAIALIALGGFEAADEATEVLQPVRQPTLEDVFLADGVLSKRMASGSLVHVDSALPPITNPNGLRRWRTALGDALFADAPVVCLVDSHTYGQNYDGANGTNNVTAGEQGYVGQLRKLFAATYGDPGEGFIFPDESRVTLGGSIGTGVQTGPAVLRHNRRFTSASHTLTLTIPSGKSIARLGLINAHRAGESATVTVTKNGGAAASISSNGSGVPAATEYACTAGDVFVLTGPSSGGLTFLGFYFRTAQTSGVVVHRQGQMGYTAPNIGGGVHSGTLWTPDGSNILNSTQLTAAIRAHYYWNATPGVVVIMSGTNEQTNQLLTGGVDRGVTPAKFATALEVITAQIVADGWCVLLVGPCTSGSENQATGAAPLSAYKAKAKSLARTSDHVAFIDIDDVWGSDAAAVASAGLRDSGSSHPTRKGYGDEARTIHRVLTTVPSGV